MKCLSIRQPWAWAILQAGKDIENRTWFTSYRGELAIHATGIESGCQLPPGIAPPSVDAMILGAVIGMAEIVDVVRKSDSPWFSGPFGFVLRNPRRLEAPVRCPGNPGIWQLPMLVETAVRKQSQSVNKVGFPQIEPMSRKTNEKACSVEEIRRSHHQAYKPWTAADDAQLRLSFLEGSKINDLVQEFARQPGGIRARLRKLGFETVGPPEDGLGRFTHHPGPIPTLEETNVEGSLLRAFELSLTPAESEAKVLVLSKKREPVLSVRTEPLPPDRDIEGDTLGRAPAKETTQAPHGGSGSRRTLTSGSVFSLGVRFLLGERFALMQGECGRRKMTKY